MKQANYSYIYESGRNIIYPVYEDRDICPRVIRTLECDLNQIVDKSFNQVTTIHTLGKYPFKTITFIGVGHSNEITTAKMRQAFSTVSKVIKEPSDFDPKRVVTDEISIHKVTQLFIETHLMTSYKEHVWGHEDKECVDVDVMAPDQDVSKDVEMAIAYAKGMNRARRLADTPSNIMTPTKLVEEAKALADEYGLECTILDKKDLEEMKAGGILAVNQGSVIPAYMICLKYTNSDTPYKAIVGKGLTFDSGGYNIKSNSYGMKYDMCGGADVLGIMEILAATKAKTNVYGIIPTTENLVSSSAFKPQDVITTLSGQTVEIVSTDAEGRLILCDALTYASRLGVSHMIDMATLTGACMRALGDVYTGVFSNDDEFYQQFAHALKESDEKGWRLPIDEAYFKMLKSKSEDFKNSAGKPMGGASIAACFLQQFVGDAKWIHLDMAGTANNEQGATGAMIRSVVEVLKELN